MDVLNIDWQMLDISIDEPERCGVVVQEDGGELTLVQVPNRSSEPDYAFIMLEDELPKTGKIVATWHSHPRGPLNLSIDDYNTFVELPHLYHLIVTTRHVALFGMVDGWLLALGRRKYAS